MPFWQFFREGRDGRALLVRPSRIPCWIWKIPFVLGSYELLAMLGGKIRKLPFFRVQSGKITVWSLYYHCSNFAKEALFQNCNFTVCYIIYVTLISMLHQKFNWIYRSTYNWINDWKLKYKWDRTMTHLMQ